MSIYASELMRKARQNPSEYEGKRYKVMIDNTHGHFIGEVNGGYLHLIAFGDTHLEEIPKSVPWQEAIQAWINGKNIKVEWIDFENNYKEFIQMHGLRFGLLPYLKVVPEHGIDRKAFKDGRWYILD